MLSNAGKKIVMCGCHEAGLKVILHLLECGITFDYFVCLTPEQGEKYEVSGYFDYREIARKYDIPYYVPETYSLESNNDIEFFRENTFDLLIQGGWQRLFPKAMLSTLAIGAIGVHGSADFLPKGRGRSPLNWSIIEKKNRFIIHYFLIKAGVDDGDVFAYQDFDITPYDDINTLYMKSAILGKKILSDILPELLSGNIQTMPQKGIPSYYPKRSPKDGLIDWETMDVHFIYDSIRAQTKPYPGAFAILNDNKLLRIWRARVFDTRITYPEASYGQIVERFGEKIIINCLGGLLLVEDYEYEER